MPLIVQQAMPDFVTCNLKSTINNQPNRYKSNSQRRHRIALFPPFSLVGKDFLSVADDI
jgi:hypothetical protein